MIKTFADFFCGLGGFHLGLKKFNLEIKYACDIDVNCKKDYEKYFNFKVAGDITKENFRKLPSVDLVCAGFPCQPFSLTGQKKGMEDPRGNLIDWVLKYAKKKKPKMLFLENVKGLKFKFRGIDNLKIILAKIDNAGYDVEHYTLNSAFYGIPQDRQRIYFVCLRKNRNKNEIDFNPDRSWIENYKEPIIPLKNILEPEENIPEKLYKKTEGIKITEAKSRLEKFYGKKRVGYINEKQSMWNIIYSDDGASPTLMLSRNCYGIKIEKTGRIRNLTALEKKRVMGFPEDYQITVPSKLGNAVIPRMIYLVYKNAIRQNIFAEEKNGIKKFFKNFIWKKRK
jgi:DNA (cytosine-5)-methyltransferase 1